jgi:hypothetical protein
MTAARFSRRVTISLVLWGLLLLPYLAVAVYGPLTDWTNPKVWKLTAYVCALAVLPLAGIGLSLVPVYLRDRGKRGKAVVVEIVTIALWFPAFVWTAVLAVF